MGLDVVPAGGRRPTLDDVAQAAGVARSTASRAINGGGRVSPRAMAAVGAAIAELGFVPNRAARSLVTQRSDAVALVIPEPDRRISGDPFFGSVIEGVTIGLHDTDLQLILLTSRRGDGPDRIVRHLRPGLVDGSIVVSHHRTDVWERHALHTGLPSVFIGRPLQHLDRFGYVDVDNRLGSYLATRHLIDTGRQRIGVIAGPADMVAGRDRLRGWRDAMAEVRAGTAAGTADTAAVEYGDFTTAGGIEAAERLFSRFPDLDGVVAANDLTAFGVIQVIHRLGRSVPGDVGVVGYDDIAAASAGRPTLSTIVQPITEMGRVAAQMLARLIDEPARRPQPVVFAPELVARESS